MKTLLVDDSIAIVDSTKVMLEESKAASVVYTAMNIASAMTQIAQRPEINLIIADFYLPDGTGLDLCAKIRAAGIKTPVLIITAAAEDVIRQVRKDVEPMGNIMVFRKPMDPAYLIYLMRAIKGTKPDSKRT